MKEQENNINKLQSDSAQSPTENVDGFGDGENTMNTNKTHKINAANINMMPLPLPPPPQQAMNTNNIAPATQGMDWNKNDDEKDPDLFVDGGNATNYGQAAGQHGAQNVGYKNNEEFQANYKDEQNKNDTTESGDNDDLFDAGNDALKHAETIGNDKKAGNENEDEYEYYEYYEN